ncbi:DUF5819 family protein [Streptomyces sp. NBC_00820]|uniref:DUF5819 family protein n=1 Tax=Streptomyces sp. NBC_00820 TaxID=2975842 RepID=UPI002ED314B2|nr:DUF5819 family protein [Streptomyces sp. NBC_00820]
MAVVNGRPKGRGGPGLSPVSKAIVLSPVSKAIVALTVLGVLVGATVHLGMIFFVATPSNIVSQKHAATLSAYLAPEFDKQNWRLFAPEPPLTNVHIHARTSVRMPDGSSSVTGWTDLSAKDDAQIVHNPLPSHARQNELGLAWFFFVNSHDAQGRPIGLYGDLSQQYLLRIAAHRIGPCVNGGTVELVQVRMVNTPVAEPKWSGRQANTTTGYQVEPWWTAGAEDFR